MPAPMWGLGLFFSLDEAQWFRINKYDFSGTKISSTAHDHPSTLIKLKAFGAVLHSVFITCILMHNDQTSCRSDYYPNHLFFYHFDEFFFILPGNFLVEIALGECFWLFCLWKLLNCFMSSKQNLCEMVKEAFKGYFQQIQNEQIAVFIECGPFHSLHRQHRSYKSESRGEPRRWSQVCSVSPTKKGWESWGCAEEKRYLRISFRYLKGAYRRAEGVFYKEI